MNNSDKNSILGKTVINWLACIYDVHHLNPYRMVVSEN